jgi:hypothetical protein
MEIPPLEDRRRDVASPAQPAGVVALEQSNLAEAGSHGRRLRPLIHVRHACAPRRRHLCLNLPPAGSNFTALVHDGQRPAAVRHLLRLRRGGGRRRQRRGVSTLAFTATPRPEDLDSDTFCMTACSHSVESGLTTVPRIFCGRQRMVLYVVGIQPIEPRQVI